MMFNYVHFPILQYTEAHALMPDMDQQFVDRAYRHWLERFLNKLNVFNQSQWFNHADPVYSAFRRLHNIREDEFYETEAWHLYRREHGLDAHGRALREADEEIEAYERWLGRPKVVTLNEALLELYEQINSDDLHPFDVAPALDELWFNTVISNTPEAQEKLRWMNYGDYLRTPHWRRVRSAMLLIHRARCARPHGRMDDGAWGEEDTMHVHHLTYKNRGNERYSDLELLCFRCHREVHSKVS